MTVLCIQTHRHPLLVEVDICPDSAMVQRLNRASIISQWGLWGQLRPLHQTTNCVHLQNKRIPAMDTLAIAYTHIIHVILKIY